MNIDIEKIIKLQTIMKSLSQGIDPTSNITFPNDTILNSNMLKASFADTYEILVFIEKNIQAIKNSPSRKRKNYKPSFYVTSEELKQIPLSDTPVPISRFVFTINDIHHHADMKKLKATQITSWLVTHGYLEEIETPDGCVCKSVTAMGEKIGITSEKKFNSRNEEYITNMYNKDAQKFILITVIPQICQESQN